MALLNYTSPFIATPAPLNPFFQPPLLPQPPQHTPYSYPVPQKPFLAEEYSGNQRTRQQNGQYNHQGPYGNQQPTGYHQHPQQGNQHINQHQQLNGAQPFGASQLGGGNQQHISGNRGNQRTSGNKQNVGAGGNEHQYASGNQQLPFGGEPVQFTRVTDDGAKTKVHAVIDYDYDDGDEQQGGSIPPVTPIQGPIYVKNGSVPVVPLYSHPVLNNGSFVQIPILWTALSVALGYELRGEYIRGVPCIKRHQQLFCPTAGNNYPLDRIEVFIDENKALMRRMYGEFEMPEYEDTGPYPPSGSSSKRKRSTKPFVPDIHFHPEDDASESFVKKIRTARQNFRNPGNPNNESGRVDACEAKTEIVTPYWASNSAGKIRAIVNTQHFEQAIHQEVCAKTSTKRCSGDCGCEQKYKWHRLLAYDPDNDCKGIFMDWFLFPSCCVCRCNP